MGRVSSLYPAKGKERKNDMTGRPFIFPSFLTDVGHDLILRAGNDVMSDNLTNVGTDKND